jgi:ATP-dependent helicase/nuclease subunit A
MADLPDMPAFLRAPAEQTGVRRGVATHKALSLLSYAPLRATGDEAALLAEVRRQLAAMAAKRQLTAEEAPLVDANALVRFLTSPCGREALAAQTVQREWGFNLRLPEQGGLIVQGVIDLCYVKDGAWALVDYKTDRVDSPAELWALYGGQMALYRRALAEATGLPVHGVTLFSLSLGMGDTRAQGDA